MAQKLSSRHGFSQPSGMAGALFTGVRPGVWRGLNEGYQAGARPQQRRQKNLAKASGFQQDQRQSSKINLPPPCPWGFLKPSRTQDLGMSLSLQVQGKKEAELWAPGPGRETSADEGVTRSPPGVVPWTS